MIAFALALALQQVPQDTAKPLPPLVITATRSPLDPSRSPLPATTLGADALRRDVRTSLADVASSVAGVRAQTTGQVIGKPVIRGLAGARVLTLDAGQRLEDYSWSDEDGPSMDPRLAERIEIIRGPASLLYGSDAIGGVVNTIPEPLPEAAPGERFHRFESEIFGATNNPGIGAGLEGQWARGAFGARAHVVGHFAGNTETPQCELENTGFSALNGELALGVHGSAGRATLRFARFGGEFKLLEAGGPGASIPAGCPGGPPKPAADTAGGPERRVEDNRVQLSGETTWHGLGLEARAQFQSHTTIEISDEVTPGQETEVIHLGLTTGTLDLLAHHQIGRVVGTVGMSGLLQQNRTSGQAPLVPDASMGNAAVFVVERLPLGRFSLLAGVRQDFKRLSADSNATLGNHPGTREKWVWSGDVGAVYEIARGVTLAANLGRAFRAPSLFELYSNGPRLGENRYEIGDPALKSETSINLDASVRWQFARVRGEVAVFRNRIDHFIYIAPTASLQVVGADTLRVYQYSQALATLLGGEASLAVDPTDRLSGFVRAEFVRGDNEDVGQPLPLMPPARVVLGGEIHALPGAARRWYAGLELEGVARQTRLAPNDIGTSDYVLVGLTGGTGVRMFGRDLKLDARVRNALDASYRNYLNRYKEFALDAGRALELRIGTEF